MLEQIMVIIVESKIKVGACGVKDFILWIDINTKEEILYD